jgi:hypothetical protein
MRSCAPCGGFCGDGRNELISAAFGRFLMPSDSAVRLDVSRNKPGSVR